MNEEFNFKHFLMNPFKYLAGYKALIVGLIFTLITAFINYSEKIHFDGIIDIHYNNYGTFILFIGENLINWIVFSILLLIGSRIITKIDYRVLDLFSTQIFARIPLIMASVLYMIVPFNKFTKYILWRYLDKGSEIALTTLDYILLITGMLIIFVVIIYVIYLMYKSYSFITNIGKKKAVISFIVIFIITEFLLKIFYLIVLPVNNLLIE